MEPQCELDDDGGPVVMAIEAPDSSGHKQSLWIRVGPVFYSGKQAKEPGVWVEYQPEHLRSSTEGPILLTPAVWRQLNAAVEWRLRKSTWPPWMFPLSWLRDRVSLEAAIWKAARHKRRDSLRHQRAADELTRLSEELELYE